MLPYSEIKYEDIIKCLEDIQVYVPSTDIEREVTILNKSGPDWRLEINNTRWRWWGEISSLLLECVEHKGFVVIQKLVNNALMDFYQLLKIGMPKCASLRLILIFNYPRGILIYNNNMYMCLHIGGYIGPNLGWREGHYTN